MKPQTVNFKILTFLFFLLILASCEKDHDILQVVDPVPVDYPDWLSSQAAISHQHNGKMRTSDRSTRHFNTFGFYNLIAFEVLPGLRGGVVCHDSTKIKLPSTFPVLVDNLSDMISIAGEGGGWSDTYGRAFVMAQLEYYPDICRIYGSIDIELYEDGSTMQIVLSGNTPITEIPEFDGPHQALVMEARLLCGTGQFARAQLDATACLLDAENLHDPEITAFPAYLMIIGEIDTCG